MARRLLAKRLLTGEVLSIDLPVKEYTPTRELNGPGGITGSIRANVALAKASDGRPIVQEWSTAIYLVEDTKILCGGPVTSLDDQGPERRFVVSGVSAWPQGQPYLDSYAPDDFEDPVTAIRALYDHLHTFPDGALDVWMDADPTYLVLSNGEAPYSIIQTEYRDIGGEFDNIISSSRIDYVEAHAFTGGPNEAIRHALRLGFPRLGANRHANLRFVEGENVIDISEVNYGSAEFSNDITVIGQGEGWAAVDDGMVARKYAPDGRLRRATVVSDPSLTTPAQVSKRAEDEYISRRGKAVVEQFTIREHANAAIADINPGDDVILTYTSELLDGQQTVYLRVTGIEEPSSNPGFANILCAPSDSFTYFPTLNPNTDGSPVVVQV